MVSFLLRPGLVQLWVFLEQHLQVLDLQATKDSPRALLHLLLRLELAKSQWPSPQLQLASQLLFQQQHHLLLLNQLRPGA